MVIEARTGEDMMVTRTGEGAEEAKRKETSKGGKDWGKMCMWEARTHTRSDFHPAQCHKTSAIPASSLRRDCPFNLHQGMSAGAPKHVFIHIVAQPIHSSLLSCELTECQDQP